MCKACEIEDEESGVEYIEDLRQIADRAVMEIREYGVHGGDCDEAGKKLVNLILYVIEFEKR
jgi:hypothetical protein